MNIPDNTKLDTIEQIAAEEVTKADKRPWHITPYAQIRREFTPYSDTAAIARQMLDSAAAFDSIGIDERDGHLSDLVDQYEPAVVRDVKARIAAAQQTGGGSGAEASSSTSGQQASGGQTSGGSDE